MFHWIYFPILSSTHQWAMEHYHQFFCQYLFVYTGHQTNGVGRKGDIWASLGESLYGSFIFPVNVMITQKKFTFLSWILCHTIIAILKREGLSPSFKKPNDILLRQKKVCGVMTSIHSAVAIVSFGLNVNVENREFIYNSLVATSLYVEKGGQEFLIQDLLKDIVNQFELNLYSFFIHHHSFF